MREISLEQVAEAVAVVGARVAEHRRDQEHAIAQQAVLMSAVGALVQTHPDAELFAKCFLRCWQRTGLSDAPFPAESPSAIGIAQALAMLETLCKEPLSARPPGQAWPPVQEQD